MEHLIAPQGCTRSNTAGALSPPRMRNGPRTACTSPRYESHALHAASGPAQRTGKGRCTNGGACATRIFRRTTHRSRQITRNSSREKNFSDWREIFWLRGSPKGLTGDWKAPLGRGRGRAHDSPGITRPLAPRSSRTEHPEGCSTLRVLAGKLLVLNGVGPSGCASRRSFSHRWGIALDDTLR